MCFGHGGVWYPTAINRCVKVSYAAVDPGEEGFNGKVACDGHFARHRDAPWIPRDDLASVYTLLFYLSGNGDDVSGGRTALFPECGGEGACACQAMGHAQNVGPALELAVSGPGVLEPQPFAPPPDARDFDAYTDGHAASAALEECAAGHKSVLIAPHRGRLLLFPHHVVHGAEPLLKGSKWVMRTELIFRRVAPLFFAPVHGSAVRVPSSSAHPEDAQVARARDVAVAATRRREGLFMDCDGYAAARALYDDSQAALSAGDVAAFVAKFHRVVEMQTAAMRATPSATALWWGVPLLGRSALTSEDALLLVCEFLGGAAAARTLMRCTHRLFFLLLRSGAFWRAMLQQRFPAHHAKITRALAPNAAPSAAFEGVEQLKCDETVAWFDAYRRAALTATVLVPAGVIVFPRCVAVLQTLRHVGGGGGGGGASSRHVLGHELAQLISHTPTNGECWLDIDDAVIHSSRLPEDCGSVYHFHIPDDERFSSAAMGDSILRIVRSPAVDPVTHEVAWSALGRSLCAALGPNPGSGSGSAAAAARVPGSCFHCPPPLVIVAHPLSTISDYSRRVVARELQLSCGASHVALVSPAMLAANAATAGGNVGDAASANTGATAGGTVLVIHSYETLTLPPAHYDRRSTSSADMSWDIPQRTLLHFTSLFDVGSAEVVAACEGIEIAKVLARWRCHKSQHPGKQPKELQPPQLSVVLLFSTLLPTGNLHEEVNAERDPPHLLAEMRAVAKRVQQQVSAALGFESAAPEIPREAVRFTNFDMAHALRRFVESPRFHEESIFLP